MKRWVPAKEFPQYEVSSEGEIRNHKTGLIWNFVQEKKTFTMRLIPALESREDRSDFE